MTQIKTVDSQLSEENIHALYDQFSSFYDLWGIFTEGRARQRAIALADIKNGENILDVATGTGVILADAARLNPNGWNTGIDLSEGMLGKARARLKQIPGRIEVQQGSCLDIPFPDGTFDLLLNGYMFDLMPFERMPQILAEFRRVLKPGGRMVLVNMTIGEKPGSHFFQWLYERSPRLMGGCRGVQLAEPVTKAGFEIVCREYQQQLLFPSEVILARRA